MLPPDHRTHFRLLHLPFILIASLLAPVFGFLLSLSMPGTSLIKLCPYNITQQHGYCISNDALHEVKTPQQKAGPSKTLPF